MVEEGDEEYGSGLEAAMVLRTIGHLAKVPLICFPLEKPPG